MATRTQWLILAALVAVGAYVMLNQGKIASTVADVAGSWTLPDAGKPYAQLFADTEQQFGLPTNLLARQAQQESYFKPDARNSRSGAEGMFQLIPRFYPGVDPNDPTQAAPAAAQSLLDYFRRFGDWQLALAAYNWGPGNLHSLLAQGKGFADLPTETQNYVTDIAGDLNLPGSLLA